MSKITGVLIIILSSILLCNAQNDTFNRLNAKGKKHGYWKVYFDQNVLKVDSLHSFFYGFQLYDNGYEVFTFFNFEEKKKLRLKYNSNLPERGKPIALTGTFYWFINDTIEKFEETYLDGLPLIYKEYRQRSTDKTYGLGELADFTKKYKNIPGTFHDTVYSLYSDHAIVFCYRKGKKRWKLYRIKGGYIL